MENITQNQITSSKNDSSWKEARLKRVFMNWRDVSDVCLCGRSKAMLIIHEVGPVRIGRTVCVRADALERYIEEHGGIDIAWPPRKRKAGE